MPFQLPANERERLKSLYQLEILDTPAEKDFDDISKLASHICNMPISYISLIDLDRQWVKSTHNLKLDGDLDRAISICNYTIEQDKVFEVPDCRIDERFNSFPYIQGNPYIRYYAGVPLTTAAGYKVGTLCVCDMVPRQLTEEQISAMEVLSRHVMNLMELRLKNKHLAKLTEAQERIISIIGHDVRNPLNSFRSVLEMQHDSDMTFSEEELDEINKLMVKQIDNTVELLNNLVHWGKLQINNRQAQAKPVDVENIITRTLRDIELATSLKGNTVRKQVEGNICIDGDDTAIEFILRNLLSNANKFTENGEIIVACSSENNSYRFSVTDTGTGMSSNQIEKVLTETGSCVSLGTRGEQGSGLGLSLVREFLSKYNSRLSIKSALGEGTTVSFSL